MRKSYRIDFIDSFASLITFTANPMSIEVGTYSIQHFAGKSVVFPLLSVELQDTLIHQVFSILKQGNQSFEMTNLSHDKDER